MDTTHTLDMILLVSSRSDPAGSLIHEEVKRLLAQRPDLAGRFQHRQFDERLIYIDGPSLNTDADCIIFLSRHASKEPRPVFTVHVTGNFGPAEYGGTPETLTDAATGMMHAIMNRLACEVREPYTVSYEATHHGPTQVPVPSCFVEIGSTEAEWNDRNAASGVARAVINAVPGDVIPLAGFGGTHYAKRQTEITLTTRGGFGHIMPTRDLKHLTRELFSTIVKSSGAQAVYIDRKSVIKEEIRRIEGYASNLDLPVVGQSDLTGLKNLSFHGYIQILQVARSILPDSSITIHALNHTDHMVPISIPSDLIAEAGKTDPTDLIAGFELLPVARLSGKGIAFYPTFITNQEHLSHISDDLIHLCVSILLRNCECTIDGDYLIIRKPRFDPEKAQSLGVPAGSSYGRLMAGEEIQIDGVTITPTMVMSISEKRICIPGWGTR